MKAYHLILKYHGAGFWSIFNKLMNYLQTYQPVYKITWDVVSPWDIYGAGEIMGPIFKTYENDTYTNYQIEDVICDGYLNEMITGKQASYLYTPELRQEHNIPEGWRLELHKLWTTYIQIQEPVLQRFEGFKSCIEAMEKKTIISMLVRHPTLSYEQLNGKMPTFEQYDNIINQISPNLEDTLIICMTDLQEAYEYFSEKYGDAVFFPNTNRSFANEQEAFIIHRGTESTAINAFLLPMYLSVGDHFIHHTSNIATAVLYMKPEIKNYFLIG